MGDDDTRGTGFALPDDSRTTIIDLARTLTGFCCPAGFEDEIRAFLVNRLKDACQVSTDRLGNVIARVTGTGPAPGGGRRPVFLLSAHVDEIGFMVSFITAEGFLRIVPLGGQNNRILPGQRVLVSSDKGKWPGVIAERPIHLLDDTERKQLVKAEDLFVDIGATSGEDAATMVSVGDFATFQPQFEVLGKGSVFSCKAGDDRIGVLVELLVLESLAKNPPAWDVACVFSTQEEIGVRGITTSAHAVDPDAAIALEVTHAIDYPGVSKEKLGDVVLGRGPSIAVGPNLHPRLTRFVINAAQATGTPHQVEVEPRPTGTDARQIQVTRGGVATGLISVPLRYMHTNIEVLAPADIHHAARLVEHVIRTLPVDLPLDL